MTTMKRIPAIAAASLLGAALLIPLAAAPAQAATPSAVEWRTPGAHSWTVPTGVERISLQIAGGAGGNERGGNGGLVTGELSVTAGDTLSIVVAAAGGRGDEGGGSDSGGSRGYGYSSGGEGGSGSWTPFVPSVGQGGGGGGGSSAVLVTGNGGSQELLAVAGGGGGGGGYAVCGGNPGGDAGQSGRKLDNNCASDGGDPGLPGQSATGTGQDGDDARSSSGQGGGGGGGAGWPSGGGGADASTDGGGGGGGGVSYCALDDCAEALNTVVANGWVRVTPVYSTTTVFDVNHFQATTGAALNVAGSVDYTAPTGLDKPQGQVTLAAGGEELVTVELDAFGRFAFTCTAPCGVTSGAHELSATYSPASGWWSASSGTADLLLELGATRTSIDVDPTRIVTGQPIDIRATVDVVAPAAGSPSGDVEFWSSAADGSDDVLLGTATLTSSLQSDISVPLDAVGDRRVWAVYPGDAGFRESESPKRTISSEAAETETAVSIDPSPSVFGQSVEVAVDVSPLSPGGGIVDGEVEIVIGDVTDRAELEDGRAVFDIDGLDVGERGLVATYLGSERYNGSAAETTHTVQPATADVALTQSAPWSHAGVPVTFDVAVATEAPGSGVPTGHVQLVVDGLPFGDPVELDDSGEGRVVTDALPVGELDVRARYGGSGQVDPADSFPVLHTVLGLDSVTDLDVPSRSVVGQPITATATVRSVPGESIPTPTPTPTPTWSPTPAPEPTTPDGDELRAPSGSVQFVVDGEDHGDPVELTTRDGERIAMIELELPVGEHTVVARYLGDASVGPSESSPATTLVTAAPAGTDPDDVVPGAGADGDGSLADTGGIVSYMTLGGAIVALMLGLALTLRQRRHVG